jgi:hypothetical protein
VRYEGVGNVLWCVDDPATLVLYPAFCSRFAPFHSFEHVKQGWFFPVDRIVLVSVEH